MLKLRRGDRVGSLQFDQPASIPRLPPFLDRSPGRQGDPVYPTEIAAAAVRIAQAIRMIIDVHAQPSTSEVIGELARENAFE